MTSHWEIGYLHCLKAIQTMLNSVLRSPITWITALLLLGISTRFASAFIDGYPPNFTALGAVALFGAASFRSLKWGMLAPMLALLFSDIVFELMQPGNGFYGPTQFVVYGAFALMAFSGRGLHHYQHSRSFPLQIGGRALIASSLFFLVTNFSVWLTSPMYSRTGAGMLQCYTAALPFFRSQIAGNLFFSAVLFGLAAVVHQYVTNMKPARA